MFNYVANGVIVLLLGSSLALAEENKEAAAGSNGFVMTGMKREPAAVETQPMSFKGMRRETATRVLKEAEEKKK